MYHIRLIFFVQSGSIPQEGHFKFERLSPDSQYRSPEESVFLNQTWANGIGDNFFLNYHPVEDGQRTDKWMRFWESERNEPRIALWRTWKIEAKKNLCLEISSNMSIEQGTGYYISLVETIM